MGKLAQQMGMLARLAGGSHKTVHDRIALTGRFAGHLQQQNIQIKRIEQLKARHIEQFIQHRLAQGTGKRTLQNEMAALRKVLQQAGRNKLAADPRLGNAALGLAGASRNGTKKAISDAHYHEVLHLAQSKDAGFAAALELARLMGLRSQEAVRCGASLTGWQQALAKGNTALHIVFGTKGGRPRDTAVLDREAVSRAVAQALVIAGERNGRLIDAPDLKTAMTYWRNHTARLGLTGTCSPHSLRYAWAQDAIRHYQAQGLSKKEVLAQVAMDLGHGDGRGLYIRQVYGQGITE